MDQVIQHKEKQRFELEVNGHTAFADYRIEKDTLLITHVEAPPALRGTGAAGKLMQGMMQQLEQTDYIITPLCSYAARWIQKHSKSTS